MALHNIEQSSIERELEVIQEKLRAMEGDLATIRSYMPVVVDRIESEGGKTRYALDRLRTISANSSLIALCAVISTVALCKMAW